MIYRLILPFILFASLGSSAIEMCPEDCPSGLTINSQFEVMACVMKVAIIGPKDDRIPIQDATLPCPPNADPNLACGMTQEQVDSILAAGMRFQCPGSDGGILNAWLLDDGKGDAERIYTNAHGIMQAGADKFVSKYKSCSVSPMTDLNQEIAIDPKQISLGSLTPNKDGMRRDRARIGLKGPVEGKPLKLNTSKATESIWYR